MSIRVLTDDEVRWMQESNFAFAEPGFIVSLNKYVAKTAYYGIVRHKDEISGTLEIVLLTQENMFSLLAGIVPEAIRIQKSDISGVHATAVTDAMCKEHGEGHTIFCADCREPIYQGRNGEKCHTSIDGLWRHTDCTNP